LPWRRLPPFLGNPALSRAEEDEMTDKLKSLMAWIQAHPLQALVLLVIFETAIFVILLGIFIWTVV
jgi:hypothetical protein